MVVPLIVGVCILMLPACRFAAGQQPEDGTPPDGSAIFSQKCAVCHGARGQGIATGVSMAGPSIRAEHDEAQVMATVESGPSHMHAFSSLTVPQIRAVSGYVSTDLAVIPMTGGDIGEGGKLFRMYCATCHRTAVRGGALAFVGMNAPVITNWRARQFVPARLLV